MQEKIIHIPFNRTFFKADQKSMWAFSIKKAVKQYIYTTLASVVLFALEFVAEKKPEFTFGKMLACGFIFYMGLAWAGLIEKRLKLRSLIKTQGDYFEKENMAATYTFNDYGVTYEDKEKMQRLSWHLLKPFEAYKDVIYIKLKQGGSIVFCLSRRELGDNEYDELYALLVQKQDN